MKKVQCCFCTLKLPEEMEVLKKRGIFFKWKFICNECFNEFIESFDLR